MFRLYDNWVPGGVLRVYSKRHNVWHFGIASSMNGMVMHASKDIGEFTETTYEEFAHDQPCVRGERQIGALKPGRADVDPVAIDKPPVEGRQLALQGLPGKVGLNAGPRLAPTGPLDVQLGTTMDLDSILDLIVGMSRKRSNEDVNLVSLLDQIGA